MNLSTLKCPNCGSNLNLRLKYAGTIRCEYCDSYIEIGAIQRDEEKPNSVNELAVDINELVADINAGIRDSSVSTSEAIMNIKKMFSCGRN